MAKEQQGWGHEAGAEDVLYDFIHCGRCKVCVDVVKKNKCFLCVNRYIPDGHGGKICTYGDEDYTFSSKDRLMRHIKTTHIIDEDILSRCMDEIATPKTKVVL